MASISPRDELTQLVYLDWQDLYNRERPFQVFCAEVPAGDGDLRTSNLAFKAGPQEVIHDVRGNEDSFSLDQHGFTFKKHSTWLNEETLSQEAVETIYLPEMEQFIKSNIDDVDRVVFFDWRIRKNVPLTDQKVFNMSDKMQHLLPSRHVHVDQAPSAVVGRIQLHLPQEAEQLLEGDCRVRVINTWRPLVDCVQDWPLCFCDAGTVQPRDLVESDHVRKAYTGMTMYSLPSDAYRWYYLNQQRRDEVTLIKIFDSHPNGPAVQTPHASFQHKDIPDSAPPRMSIETRALVFSKRKSEVIAM